MSSEAMPWKGHTSVWQSRLRLALSRSVVDPGHSSAPIGQLPNAAPLALVYAVRA